MGLDINTGPGIWTKQVAGPEKHADDFENEEEYKKYYDNWFAIEIDSKIKHAFHISYGGFHGVRNLAAHFVRITPELDNDSNVKEAMDLFMNHSDCDGGFSHDDIKKIYDVLRRIKHTNHVIMMTRDEDDSDRYYNEKLEELIGVFENCAHKGFDMWFL